MKSLKLIGLYYSSVMTYYENKGEVNGIEYTIQQVRSPDSKMGQDDVSAWIDGLAVYLDTIENNPEIIPTSFEINNIKNIGDIKAVMAYLLDTEQMPCKQCEELRDIDDMIQTNFAGCTCRSCKYDCENSNGHDYTCLNPGQKNNARVHTKFKCDNCGKKKFNVATA